MGDFNKGDKINIVSQKIRDRFNINNQPNINPKLKIKSYKTKPSVAVSINSGAVILSIGIILGLSIPAANFESYLNFSQFEYQNGINDSQAYDGLARLFFQLMVGLFVSYQSIWQFFVISWFVGGFFAALMFQEEGKRGPYYSAVLAISVTMMIAFLIGIIVLTLNNGVFEFDLVFLPMIFALILSLFLTIISIPLTIIALLGYRMGSLIAND
ncbi:MAG: hypothetical protein ACW99A_06130 [Candidatus Kariarchaeaceae archaeon]|jgi:hypothetical protein